MKKLFIMLVVVLTTFTVNARNSRDNSYMYRKGYRGNVEMGGVSILNKDVVGSSFSLYTVHGYSFGNGAFIGGGIGLDYSLVNGEAFVPVFFSGKYNFLNRSISPFVEMRTGYSLGATIEDSSYFLSPSIGVDFSRFSIRLAYQLSSGSTYQYQVQRDVLYRLHELSMTFAVNF